MWTMAAFYFVADASAEEAIPVTNVASDGDSSLGTSRKKKKKKEVSPRGLFYSSKRISYLANYRRYP